MGKFGECFNVTEDRQIKVFRWTQCHCCSSHGWPTFLPKLFILDETLALSLCDITYSCGSVRFFTRWNNSQHGSWPLPFLG